MPIKLDRALPTLLTLGQLGGNLLSLPKQVEGQTQQQEATKALATQLLGLDQAAADKLFPAPALQFLNPASYGGMTAPEGSSVGAKIGQAASGTLGKLLEGTGDVGMILNGILGGGGGGGESAIPLQTITALAGLQRGKDSAAATAAYRDKTLAQGDARTQIARERLEFDKTKPTRGPTDAGANTTARIEAERNARLGMVDQIGLTDEKDRATFIATGKLPPQHKTMTYEDFFKMEAMKPGLLPGERQAPEDVARNAYKQYQAYLKGSRKAGKGTKGASLDESPPENGARGLKDLNLSPAGELAAAQILDAASKGEMDPDEATRRITAIHESEQRGTPQSPR